MAPTFTTDLPTAPGLYCMGFNGRYVTVDIFKTKIGELSVKFPLSDKLFLLTDKVFIGTQWHGPKDRK